MAGSTTNPDDLYLETDKLYVGSICEVLAGNYHTIKFPEKVKYFPRCDDDGFVLHKDKINSREEIGQKIIDLKHQFDNVFYPRHYNDKGVETWCDGSADCSYGFYNYIVKLEEAGLLNGEVDAKGVANFFGVVDPDSDPEEIQQMVKDFTIYGAYSGSKFGPKDGSEGSLDFVDEYATSLLMTSDLGIFDKLDSFSIKSADWGVLVFDGEGGLAAVICKVFTGYTDFCFGDEPAYMVSKEQDILFVAFQGYDQDTSDGEFDCGDYQGPNMLGAEQN